MRKIVVGMHTSLDGFVGGPHGEMDWVKVNEEIFDIAGEMTDQADTALYGKNTWQMMDSYWPTAGDPPDASKHDKEHSAWYNRVNKVVVSKSMQGQQLKNTQVVGNNLAEEITQLKNGPGRNIQIFGSPSTCHALMQHDLIDEYWLFVNPILLGKGIPMFKDIQEKAGLQLVSSRIFSNGVAALHYERVRG
jgi:dihydrofolate reductase